MKKVSVIIPCYNAEKYIKGCFEQLKQQSLSISDMEIIFVNDGSLDMTGKIISEIVGQYPDNVFLVDVKNNRGVSSARNCGIEAATAPYLAFVDCDDMYDRKMLQKMVEAAEEYDCDIVECSMLLIRNGQEGVVIKTGTSRYLDFSDSSVRGQYFLTYTHSVCAKMFRTSFIRREKLSFDEKIEYGEDALFSGTTAMLANGIYRLEECLYYYRINNEGSAINRLSALNRIDEMAMLKERLVAEYRRRGIYDEVMETYKEQFQNAMMLCCYYPEVREIYSEIYRLRDNVKEIFPDIRNNRYLQILDERHKKYMSFFDN